MREQTPTKPTSTESSSGGSTSDGSTSEEPRPEEPISTAIERAVQQHLKSTIPLDCHRVGDGCDHVAWRVGNDHIYRALPWSRHAVGAMNKENTVRKLVNRYQRLDGTVPECMGIVSVGEWVGNLDIRVIGTSLEDRLATHRTETDLTQFVMAQWSVPVHEAEAILGNERDIIELDILVPEAHQAWKSLLGHGNVADQTTILSNLLETNDDARGLKDTEADMLLHKDFKGEHIFVKTSSGDDDDGALAGVIDWTDAMIGDVAIDVGGLAISVGQQMAKRIDMSASVSCSAIERGITMARCDTVIRFSDYVNGDEDDVPEWLLRRQFQRAFEGTLLENALL